MATLTETFTNIADAIRSKTETTDKITPENMPAMIESISVGAAEPVIQELSITSNGTYRAPEGIDGYTPITVNVPQDGGPTAEELTITHICDYLFAYGGWDWFINKYGNQITTQNISSAKYMFSACKVSEIPFEINLGASTGSGVSISRMLYGCNYLLSIPKISGKISNMGSLFSGCYLIKEIPEDIENWLDFTELDNYTGSWDGEMSALFYQCRSLRSIPKAFLKHYNRKIGTSSVLYNQGFAGCFVLDELVDLPASFTSTWASSAFYQTIYECNRLKRFVFETNEDGTPKVVNWKKQSLDFTSYVGYAGYASVISYGLTEDTRITDDATYQALKDNPDSWTTDINYSRYNKTSAIETINSLPDTSAYLATQSGATNTIKFKGEAGALTDGGAINTMTEEEIAVATAKGWTVSFV